MTTIQIKSGDGTSGLLAGELAASSLGTGFIVGNAVNEAQDVSILHASEHQPLGNKKVWLDTANMVVKVNQGAVWEPKVGEPVAVNQGGFLDEIYVTQGLTHITIRSFNGYPILYSTDSAAPSIPYTEPIPRYEGTLKVQTVGPLGDTVEVNVTRWLVIQDVAVQSGEFSGRVDYDVVLSSDRITEPVFMSTFLGTSAQDYIDGYDIQIAPGSKPGLIRRSSMAGSVLYIVITDSLGNILEYVERVFRPVPFTIAVETTDATTDIRLSSPASTPNLPWKLQVRNTATGEMDYEFKLPYGSRGLALAGSIQPGEYEFKAVYYDATAAEPEKTAAVSNSVIATVLVPFVDMPGYISILDVPSTDDWSQYWCSVAFNNDANNVANLYYETEMPLSSMDAAYLANIYYVNVKFSNQWPQYNGNQLGLRFPIGSVVAAVLTDNSFNVLATCERVIKPLMPVVSLEAISDATILKTSIPLVGTGWVAEFTSTNPANSITIALPSPMDIMDLTGRLEPDTYSFKLKFDKLAPLYMETVTQTVTISAPKTVQSWTVFSSAKINGPDPVISDHQYCTIVAETANITVETHCLFSTSPVTDLANIYVNNQPNFSILPGDSPSAYYDWYEAGTVVYCYAYLSDNTLIESKEVIFKPESFSLTLTTSSNVSELLTFSKPIAVSFYKWQLVAIATDTLIETKFNLMLGATGFQLAGKLQPGEYLYQARFLGGGPEFAKTTVVSNVLLGTITAPYVGSPTWEGYSYLFKKLGTDAAVEYDTITPKVILTRSGTDELYNAASESSFTQGVSPSGTLWAFYKTGPNQATALAPHEFNSDNHSKMIFSDWTTSHDDHVKEAVNMPAVVYLAEEDIYVDILITEWDSDGDRFSYKRATSSSVRNSATAVAYGGSDVVFSKLSSDSPNTVYDAITPKIQISRYNTGGPIVNILEESKYNNYGSPSGVLFAFDGFRANTGIAPFNSTMANFMSFEGFRHATDSTPPDIVNVPGVIYLIEENIFLDFCITTWGVGGDGDEGVVAYTRAALTSTPVTLVEPPPLPPLPPVKLYGGFDVNFVKVITDDPFIVTDPLTAKVSLSRLNGGGPLINTVKETSCDSASSPSGVQFAFSNFSANIGIVPFNSTRYADMTFQAFKSAIGSSPPDSVDFDCVMRLIEDNIYLDVDFTYWGIGSAEAGTFTYNRSDLTGAEVQPYVAVPSGPPLYTALQTSKVSPQTVGTNVQLTAKAYGGAPTYTYAFFYKLSGDVTATAIQADSALDSCTWDTTGLALGTYEIWAVANNSISSEVKTFEIAAAVASTAYWKGTDTALGAFEFVKPDGVQPASYNDPITPNVTFTRGGTGFIYNLACESVYVTNVSPLKATWAFENIGPNVGNNNITADAIEKGLTTPIFTDIRTASGNNSNSMVGKRAVVYLTEDDIYMDIIITQWSAVNGAGGMRYKRATAVSTLV